MLQQFLWVNDAEGKEARQREAKIRSHVQTNRRKASSKFSDDNSTASGKTKGQQPDTNSTRGLPLALLRPSKSLGRLAPKKAKTGVLDRRKEARGDPGTQSAPRNSIFKENGSPLIKTLPQLWPGLSSAERGSLAFFQIKTSQEWSGWEDQVFWNVLAPQVSQESQAVARSLIAVSALHERINAIGSVERTRLQRLSLESSSRATRALLARSEISYFEALVSCVIMICYHGLQNSQASFVLLRSGMRLLAECNDPGQASSEERRMVEVQLAPLFSRLVSRPCSMVDPCRAFALSVDRHRYKATNLAVEKPVIPQKFSTTTEARDSLNDILNWAHDNFPSGRQSETLTGPFLRELHGLRDVWQTAFAGACFTDNEHSIKSARLLRAACLVGVLITSLAHYVEETACDQYQDDFVEILSLAADSWPSSHSFGIDAGLLDMMAFVGSKCRDPLIRRRALQLLKGTDRLEGDRIAHNPAIILEALIALEERGLEVNKCDYIPEQNRRRLVCGQQRIQQGRIDLFFTSGDGTQKETCCVSLAGPNVAKTDQNIDSGENPPDAIFGIGYAEYLENLETLAYFRLELDRFYFPIPKV